MPHLHEAVGGSRGSPHFNGSDGQKHGKSKVVKGWLLEQGAFTGKFDDVDMRVSINFGVSNGKVGLDFLLPNSTYQICIYIRPRMDLGVPDDTENPKFFKDGCWKSEHSPANSIIFVDLRVSTNFSVYNGKLGLDFLIRPLVNLGQIRRCSSICGSSRISASPTKN